MSVSFDGHLALDDVDLELPPGRSLALVGPNGSGKTTLLHVLAGLVEPTTGAVEVRAQPVAYVLQRHQEHPWMPLTAREVVRMGRYRQRGALRRLTRADRRATDAAAERMGVTEVLERQYGELSGGQRQRVLVAQALVQEATTLLLDEPVTGLDIGSRRRILEIVTDQTAAGGTVVMSTHDLDEARRCDAVALLDAGRVRAVGTPDEVLTVDHLSATFGGAALGEDADGHTVVVDDHGHGHL